jgi:hypothetical protein
MNTWRILRGPEMIAEVKLGSDPTEEDIKNLIKENNIDLDFNEAKIKIGRNMIYVTGRRNNIMIDIMKV